MLRRWSSRRCPPARRQTGAMRSDVTSAARKREDACGAWAPTLSILPVGSAPAQFGAIRVVVTLEQPGPHRPGAERHPIHRRRSSTRTGRPNRHTQRAGVGFGRACLDHREIYWRKPTIPASAGPYRRRHQYDARTFAPWRGATASAERWTPGNAHSPTTNADGGLNHARHVHPGRRAGASFTTMAHPTRPRLRRRTVSLLQRVRQWCGPGPRARRPGQPASPTTEVFDAKIVTESGRRATSGCPCRMTLSCIRSI
jgi:hypothetical protein